jgi:hypothetical protein
MAPAQQQAATAAAAAAGLAAQSLTAAPRTVHRRAAAARARMLMLDPKQQAVSFRYWAWSAISCPNACCCRRQLLDKPGSGIQPTGRSCKMAVDDALSPADVFVACAAPKGVSCGARQGRIHATDERCTSVCQLVCKR